MKYRVKYRTTHPGMSAVALVLGVGLLSACSSVSDLTKQRVAQSETSVQQAKGQGNEAERLAAQAHLYAELAMARAQSADARKAANEVLASLDMLRQETERNTPKQR
jgi:uncharacterized protein YceK